MLNRIELLAGGLFFVAIIATVILVQNRFGSVAAEQEDQVAQLPRPSLISVNTDVPEGDEQSNREKAVMKKTIPLMIDDIQFGSGKTVEIGSEVTLHYAGALREGLVFENSRERGEPVTMIVGDGQVVRGLEEGLLGMREGGERIVVVPPQMGYGSDGTRIIPSDSVLIFKVKLLEVT